MDGHVSDAVKKLVHDLLKTNEKNRPDVSDLLVDPTVLPFLISIHCDLGRLEAPTNDKRKPSTSLNSRLRTYTTQSTLRPTSVTPLVTRNIQPTPSTFDSGLFSLRSTSLNSSRNPARVQVAAKYDNYSQYS
ncbi:hypothetical protein B9Z55_002518 [Caenorhabditis nigoni]|nr:hypothetical protein B9Z55_002518 [Caenorhabditis nigoni]